ncbi:MAG TPA: site-2 protease family protein [Terriglobales bacterium]|nr:site-2 protease family protein [Terriglobales bacterium]
MSEPHLPPPVFVAPEDFREVVLVEPPRRPYATHLGLFLLTFLFSLIVGARLDENFAKSQPLFINDVKFFAVSSIWKDPKSLLDGLPFAASLLGILMAHEMGHFLYALKHRVYSTLPYFIPAPTPVGTFGAFILIKSRFRSLASLFDIGMAGPIGGFVVAVPLALVGLALSKPLPVGSNAAMNLGYPPIFHLLYAVQHGWDAPLETVLLHPVAIAAWIGMLATALNLLPGGQLDGGHIIYSLSPGLHGKITRVSMAVLLPLSIFFWPGWLIWVFGLWFTRRHPYVPEYPTLDVARRRVAFLGLIMFVLSFTPEPFLGGGLYDVFKGLLP